MLRRITPKLGDLLFVCVFAGSMLLGQRMLNQDSDLGRHIVLGTYILRTGSIPQLDILSHTLAGEPRPPYEWLAQVVLAATNLFLGLDGVVLLTAVVISYSLWTIYQTSRQDDNLTVIAFVVALWAALASSLHWLTRPHVFTFLCLALWMNGLEQVRTGRSRRPWILFLLMLVWANLHGGFVFGFIAWGAYFIGSFIDKFRGLTDSSVSRRLLAVGLGSLLASVITPGLWNNWLAVLRNRNPYILATTVETARITPGVPAYWPFIALVAAGSLFLMLDRRRILAQHAALFITFGFLAIAMARNVPLFSIVVVPIITRWATEALAPSKALAQINQAVARVEGELLGGFWPTVPLAAAVLLISCQRFALGRSIYSFDPTRFPVAAVDWVEAHPLEGKMFNDFNWGGYLLYRMWPTERVFIDSQSDFYGEDFLRRYAAILDASQSSEQLLQQYDVAWVIIRQDAVLGRSLAGDPNWRRAYQDATSTILVRSTGYASPFAHDTGPKMEVH